jgi:rSAM/selenodomain-associated transferase 1
VIAAQIVVIAKEPLAGKVKTRLAPVYGPRGAAALALAALQDTLAAALASGASRVVLALDGRPGGWLPYGVAVVSQCEGPLGDRLAGAIAGAYRDLSLPVLVIGMDTPQVSAGLLDTALCRLTESAAVLGPAEDGGYWCIGLQRPDAHVFDHVPMSMPCTGSAQLAQLAARGLATAVLPSLRDVDLPTDVPLVATQAPGSRFAFVAGLSDSSVA